MNVSIASGDYAAIISDLSYTGGATGALEDGIIVDLTDDLPEFSPNYQYLIDSNPEVAPIFRNDGRVLLPVTGLSRLFRCRLLYLKQRG